MKPQLVLIATIFVVATMGLLVAGLTAVLISSAILTEVSVNWIGRGQEQVLALDIGTGELELRHTLPLRGAGGATPEQIEDVVDIMLGECEHCFPAIFQVASNQLSAVDAAAAALFTTEGEA